MQITQAVELEAGRRTKGVNDIRWWIEGRQNDELWDKRIWGEVHGLETEYDSDGTEYDYLRFPDEKPTSNTWFPRNVGNNFFSAVDNNFTASD